MSRCIINAMIAPYDGAIEPVDEVWCVNGAFRHQKGVTRIYAMDDLSYLPTGWADEVNLVKPSVRYITTRHFDEIPRSEAYPIVETIRYFNGIRFFVCTMAYAFAAAIREGFKTIVLSGGYWAHDSEEYVQHLACMDFWAGMAIGSGVKLEIHGPCMLCKPYQWEPSLYGYETNTTRHIIHAAMAAAYKFAAAFPYQPQVHVDVDKMIEEAARE
jgi:hypothetical protein